MNLNKVLATNNNCYKAGKSITPKGVMVHSTGADNPWLKRYVQPDDGKLGTHSYDNHFNTAKPGGRSVCPHAVIGKLKDGSIATYQILPWDMKGWHSGKGTKGSANDAGYIGFEICEDGLTDKSYCLKVYKEAVELTAYLCKKYNLNPLADGVVICHSEGYKRGIASNHGDVMHWFPQHGKSMDTFRQDVEAAMAEEKTEVQNNTTTTEKAAYRVQAGAYRTKASADALRVKIKAAGFNAFVVYVDGLYKVQVGAFNEKANADALLAKVKQAGFDAFVTKNGSEVVSAAKAIQKGSVVRVKKGAKTYSGDSLASFVYSRNHVVKEISGNRVVITYNGVVVAAVHKDNLTLV